MTRVWRFIRQWWWAFVAVAGGIFAVAWRLMATPSQQPTQPDPVNPPPPPLADRAKQEVERVRLEGEVEKARARATAEAHHEEITRIQEVGKTDPKEARKQLAGWLSTNL